MWQWMIYGTLFAGLSAQTYFDIREKKIWLPAAVGVSALLLTFQAVAGQVSLSLFAASLGVGAVFFLFSVAAGGKIGKGDAFLFAMTGAGVGLFCNLLLVYLTFLFAFAAAVFLRVAKKVKKDYRIPLAPFVLLAYCAVLSPTLAGALKGGV